MDKRTKKCLGKVLTTEDLELLYNDLTEVSHTLSNSDCELERFACDFTEDELKAMAHIIVTFELVASKYGVSKQLEKLINQQYRKYLKNIVREVELLRFMSKCNGNTADDFEDDDTIDDIEDYDDCEDCSEDYDDSVDDADHSNIGTSCENCADFSTPIKDFGVSEDYDDSVDDANDSNSAVSSEDYVGSGANFNGDEYFNDSDDEYYADLDDIDKSTHEEPLYSDEPSVYSNFPKNVNGSLLSEDDVNTIKGIVGDTDE